ncbi:hypothetical protein Daus18300_007286 [Diaporthe australafricana]|uniref:BTB domain-containing protein n=1 Tax=Diaporthe australafricana TaxID=127596 RepID=A0ABR3WNL3_9PEZI
MPLVDELIITISVGDSKTKFAIHANLLSLGLNAFLCTIDGPVSPDGHVDLPDEEPETFRKFMNWLYAAHMDVKNSELFPFLPSSTAALFKLYAFAVRFVACRLQDLIIRRLHAEFSADSDLWLTLGSDASTLKTFLEVVKPETLLYKLVMRSLAFSIRSPPGTYYSSCGVDSGIIRPGRGFELNTESRVGSVMESVPSELWGPVMKEILLAKHLCAFRSFDSIVGDEASYFLPHPWLDTAAPRLANCKRNCVYANFLTVKPAWWLGTCGEAVDWKPLS